MGDPKSQVIVEIIGSVTKDEAVALLLGWSVDPKRSAFVRLDRFGITDDQFRTLPSMGQSVSEILSDQLNVAQDMLQHSNSLLANDQGPAPHISKAEADEYRSILANAKKEANEAQAKIDHWNQEIEKAAQVMRDITTEFNKNSSQLEKAMPEDVTDGRILISIDSLDLWARKNYNYSVKTGQHIGKKRLYESESQTYGNDKVTHLMCTLALMVERYAEIGPPYSRGVKPKIGDESEIAPKASFNAIGEEIMLHANALYGVGTVEAQGMQTIRKLLKEADKVLRDAVK